MASDLVYECAALAFAYRGESVLGGVDLKVAAGELVALAGPSGSGKTTLLNLLGMIEPPQGGLLRYRGQDVARLAERELTRIRRLEIGFVFQDFHLIDVLTAAENVEYFAARQGLARSAVREIAARSLEDVGLYPQRGKMPAELSGGQRQRVALARALAKSPRVVIADEPTASLDQASGLAVIELLARLGQERGVTTLLASHDPMVLGLCPRVVRLRDGRLAPTEKETSRAG